MAVSLSKRTARHAACEHADFTTHGWPRYCDQCADPVTITYWPSLDLTSDVIIHVLPGVQTSHRARVSVAA